MTDRQLYRPERAAEALDCGRTTVYALMATGELESVKIGRSRRIPADSLARYIDSLRRPADTPRGAA